MKKVLILMLVFAAVAFAAQVDKDGDVLLTSPYEVIHGMEKSDDADEGSVVLVAPVAATMSLPHYEGFDYTDGDYLGVHVNWTEMNSGDSIVITSGSLSYDGLAGSTGNKVSFNGSGLDPYLTFEEVTSGPVYASFIFKVTDQSAMTDLTDGGYFAAIADTTFSYDARMWVRPNPTAAGTTFDIGFGYVSSSPPTTTGTYNIGDEIFVVMSYNLDDGVVSAWINPASTDFEAATVPTATLTSTEATPATKLSKFILRQDSDGETPFMELDELRLGTTWADVTPAAPVAAISLPHYEGFDYSVGDTIGVQATNWTMQNSGDSIVVTPGSLSYTGLAVPTGNSISFNGSGVDPYFVFDSVKTGSVFASFIFKVTDQSAMTDLTDGGYFAGLSESTFSYDARIWVRPNPDAAGSTFDIGFGNMSSSPPTTTETYNIGDEILVVMSYTIDDGVVSAWINPSYDDFEATILPTATITGTDATPATSISKFIVRQDSDGETPFIEFDELRLGTTWAEVTPAAVVAPVDNDLNLTFEDDSDVANWGVHGGTSGYTTVAHNATGGVGGTGAIEFGDGGYGFYIKRPVSGTVGTEFQLTIDVKTANWDNKDTYPITIAVEGLGAAAIGDTINALADFTTIVLTGTITNADGYIVIAGGNTLLANNVWIDNLIYDDDYQAPANLDLNLTFDDDSDVANWGVHDGSSGYTTVAHNATGGVGGTGAIEFGDGGYAFLIKRPVSATVGTQYNFTIDVKTVGWDTPATYPITIAIEGLDATPVSASINALSDLTSIPLTGLVTNADGYIAIVGSNTSAAGAGGTIMVTIDNLVFDDAADIPDTDPPTIVMAEAPSDTTVVIEFSEDIDPTTGAVLTNYVIDHAIGNPAEATVFENTVTLKVSNLASDTLYTMTVNNVEDLSENVIATDSEITFMWQAYVPGPDLFFSEYIEGSSNNKALEIFNGKGVAVNLAEYSIRGTHNGDADWAYAVFNFPDIELAAGDVYIISNTDAGPEIAALADTMLVYDVNKTASYNGDDARALFWGEYMLDMIGFTDGDPGTNWPVAGGVGATSEYTLVRKAEVTMGNVDWAVSSGTDEASSEWVVMPVDVFRFLGSHPHSDLTGPEIVGVVTVGDSLVQIRFSEKVDSTAAVNVANYVIDGGVGSPVSASIICMHVVTLKLDAGHYLAPNVDYNLIVNDVPDLVGNVIMQNTTVLVRNIVPGELPIDITINDFETDIGNWAHPTYSGSTSGILTTSTFEVADTLAYMGAKSGKMTLLDDPAVNGGWFVRLWNINRVDKLAADSKLFLYLRGADADIQIRLVIRDDGSGGDNGYEAGAWHDITVTEDDWQVVSLDLLNDPVTGWVNGNGVITSTNTVSIDCIQLQCSEDISPVLYFDMITERPNIAPVEVTFEVDMSVQTILGNFNIANDFVDIAGSLNDWGGNSMVLDDADGDSIYSITVLDLYPGENLEYKFRINGSWDDATCEFPYGGPNRSYAVPDSNSVVFHWYDDKDRSALGIEDISALPKEFALHQNYPNPFNPITTIKYELPKESLVKIIVFNLMGKEVRTLVSQKQNAGYQTVIWDALDNFGRQVSSGYYIYIMQAESFHKTQKMILLK